MFNQKAPCNEVHQLAAKTLAILTLGVIGVLKTTTFNCTTITN